MSPIAILYIDDDKENLIGFEAGFSKQYPVYTAQTIAQAETLMQEHSAIGVVMVDYKMPVEDGISFAKRFKGEYPNLVFIITSAWADIDVVSKAMSQNNLYSFVQKPWNHTELAITLRNASKYYQTINEVGRLNLLIKVKEAQLKSLSGKRSKADQ